MVWQYLNGLHRIVAENLTKTIEKLKIWTFLIEIEPSSNNYVL